MSGMPERVYVYLTASIAIFRVCTVYCTSLLIFQPSFFSVVTTKKEADAAMCADALTDNFDNLVAALPIRNLLPKFISRRIVMFRDQEKILAGETDEDKRARFLKHITDQLSSGNTDSFHKFLEILKKHGGSYSYLASDIEKRLDELQEASVITDLVTAQDSETVHPPGTC